MKKFKLILILISIYLVSSGIFIFKVHADVNIYRVYNSNSSEHFYTKDTNEMFNLINNNWKSEGVAWASPQSGTAVYRIYNPNSSGDHYYTSSKYEAQAVVNSGWKWDNNGNPVFFSGGSIPVYVSYNPNAHSGSHNYTTNKNEQNALINAGWKDQGTAFYATKAGWVALARIDGGNKNIFQLNPPADATEAQINSYGSPSTGIEANMTLSGSGSGYQAKFGYNSFVSSNGISFGTQYNQKSDPVFSSIIGKIVFVVENTTNLPSYHLYSYYTIPTAPVNGSPGHIKLVHFANQNISAYYLNGKFVGSQLSNIPIDHSKYPNGYIASAQVSAGSYGDFVKGQFSNVSLTGSMHSGTWKDASSPGEVFAGSPLKVSGSFPNFTISGTITAPGDWDSNPAAHLGGYQTIVSQ